jgi:DNA/RNA-binding domain of Phe-tRNA-synthetase-like protein
LLTVKADYLVASIIYHDPALRTEFSTLVAAALVVEGVDRLTATELDPVPHLAAARARLADTTEGTLPEIRAWRAAFAAIGLKPTQYRCASESLLRRLRTQGDMPTLHPLIDFGNAVSAAFAIPLAIFDIDHVALPVAVTHAMGDERYVTFAGEEEHPEPGEVIFCDAEGWAHSRRWTHRQSGRSAVRASTRRALLVTEALHDGATDDVARVADTLTAALQAAGAQVERVATVY